MLQEVATRNNVVVAGNPDGRPIVFAHGFGCDQNMWRLVAPAFEADYRIVLFDYVGAGASDIAAYDEDRYATLDGYALDILDVVESLDLDGVVLVAHSVSSMIGALAVKQAPERFAGLVMIGPSPRYLNDEGYVGGFDREDIDGLLNSLESNYLGWSESMAPVIMGNPDRPDLGAELTTSFCRTDPDIQKRFARATFLSDNRSDLATVSVPTLVLQCSDDVIAPDAVGRYVAANLPDGRFVQMAATGHCPNLSAPQETVEHVAAFLDDL